MGAAPIYRVLKHSEDGLLDYNTVRVRDVATFLKHHPKSLRHWYDNSYVSEEAPIVIGGCGRSGTNLLRAMLHCHQDIACGPESNFLVPWLIGPHCRIQGSDLCGPWLEDVASKFDVSYSETLELWSKSECQAHFVDQFFSRWINLHFPSKRQWAEKTPANVRGLGWLWKHWPKARFIHVLRDGRDVVCSLRNHPRWKVEAGVFLPTNNVHSIKQCAKRWALDVSAGLSWRDASLYYEIRYEQLVQAPEQILRETIHWLGETWDDNMLHYYKASWDLSKNPQAEGIDKPLFTNSIGRWKRDLTAQELSDFWAEAKPLMDQLGYTE